MRKKIEAIIKDLKKLNRENLCEATFYEHDSDFLYGSAYGRACEQERMIKVLKAVIKPVKVDPVKNVKHPAVEAVRRMNKRQR